MKAKTNEDHPIHKTLTEALPDPIIDEASATVTYKGWAPLGTPQANAEWKICRITKANATAPFGVIITEWADGNQDYDNIWNNRATLAYSR
jgi:hypothetical protein